MKSFSMLFCGSFAMLSTINIFSAHSLCQKSVEEIWAGTLDVGAAKLGMVVHLTKKSDGSFVSTMDSPDQGAKGIPVAKTTFEGGKLRLEVMAVLGVFEGAASIDGKEIKGNWEQGGEKFPLTLVKVDKAPEVKKPNRPQTPKKPYPYTQTEVTYEINPTGIK